MITKYHAKYFAHALNLKGGQGIDSLSRSLMEASVDLNPHQIEAALFAIQNPLSKGVILADEVGLGKTIEAGLVLCQLWAEGRRRIIIMVPASLRKQWALELEEKFYLPSIIIDAREFKKQEKEGHENPFMQDKIVICSTHFASRYQDLIRQVCWNLGVIDEAHKLRNAYKPSNKMGKNIAFALKDTRKMLLTATPLQNRLEEMFGLSLVIDENIFGDLNYFKKLYVNNGAGHFDLRDRLSTFVKRNLRSQVQEYIRYTERKLITQTFKPSRREMDLYNRVSDFLTGENRFSFPASQKHLIALLLRKMMASSTYALAGTLSMLKQRLELIKSGFEEHIDVDDKSFFDEVLAMEDVDEEFIEEYLFSAEEKNDILPPPKEFNLLQLNDEIKELQLLIDWAHGIPCETKLGSLLTAIKTGFDQMAQMGASKKAVIFTESRRTQVLIKNFLNANGYSGQIVTFNGVNNEPESKAVYEKWKLKNHGNGRSTGSRMIDSRTALIEAFQDEANILIATEAASEGVNLQFCSLVINYDLPWNPQRIEQRIGRCHRYGQEFDVVVINFLNEKNQADARVYELLNQKFHLFQGVFGSSDDVLGTLESGVDFEKRIFDIFQDCRSPKEITRAFDDLQKEMEHSINEKMDKTRKTLLDNFDEDVHQRLKTNLEETRFKLDRYDSMFWRLTKFVLREIAVFNDEKLSFELKKIPISGVFPGNYQLQTKKNKIDNDFWAYRINSELGKYVLKTALELEVSQEKVQFDLSGYENKISILEQHNDHHGLLSLLMLTIEIADQEDQFILPTVVNQKGEVLSPEFSEKLFQLAGEETGLSDMSNLWEPLKRNQDQHKSGFLQQYHEEKNKYFKEEQERIFRWAEDKEKALDENLKNVKNRIRALEREAKQALTDAQMREKQKQIKKLEKEKRKLRNNIFDMEDEIYDERERLIELLESRMEKKITATPLFNIGWELV